MRIVVVLKTDDGGMWILPHLEEMVRRGHEPVVVIPAGRGRLRARLDADGVRVVESAFDFRFRPGPSTARGLWRLRRQLRALRPDVLQYHLYASALGVRLATLGLGTPRVHMVAGPLYLDSPAIRAVERVAARLDDVVIAGSEHTALRYRGLVGSRPRVTHVAYGLPAGRFTPASAAEVEAARTDLGVDDSAVLFVMVALVYAPKRLVHRGLGIKGHDLLLTSWLKVSTARPTARLLLVGGGFDTAGEVHRQELLERFAVAENPTVSWFATTPDVRHAYAAADVSVSPSRSENHGAAREASACGVPSVVSDAGGLPETIVAGSGWLVASGSVPALTRALIRVHDLGRPELARHGRVAAEHEARTFDPAVLAERVVDVVESVARA